MSILATQIPGDRLLFRCRTCGDTAQFLRADVFRIGMFKRQHANCVPARPAGAA